MRKGFVMYIADDGNHFVLTKKGYERNPLPERKIAFPVPGFERQVPPKWIEKGYVVECKAFTCMYMEKGKCESSAECMWCPVITTK